MAISSITRKKLWAKSANRCTICKKELIKGQEKSQQFNIGEECHIISSKLNGPRHKPSVENYDNYDNVILLCNEHHTEVDTLIDTYTEEVLRYFKANHENWVQKTLSQSLNPEKIDNPKFLYRITTGKELLNIIFDSHGYRFDYDDIESSEEAEYIASSLQTISDYGDLSVGIEVYDKVKISLDLSNFLKELEIKGYYIFGERKVEKMKLSNNKFDDWSVATIIIKKKSDPQIIKSKFMS